MKKCTKSLAIKERQIKTTIRGVPWWLSGLRIQHRHCRGLAHRCDVAWGPALAWERLHYHCTAKPQQQKAKVCVPVYVPIKNYST